MGKNGAMAGASQAALRAAAARPKLIAEKGGKSKDREWQAESDSDNDELEDDTSISSSSSSVIVRKQHASDKHALMSAQLQDEQISTKTVQASIDKQKKVNAEKGRELAEHSNRHPSADHHATDSEHHVIVHLHSQDFPFICASISSSSSSVFVRKRNTSDKHTLMSAQQQEEQLLPKTVQPSIDKQIKVTAEKGRDLAAHCTRYPFADHHATDSEHHVIEHLYSPEFPFIYTSICIQ